MGELFAVLSGKGGTGKTSVCAGIATALAEQGKKVLCIDCDVGLRNLDISLGMTESGALSFLDVAEGAYPLDRAARHPVYLSLAFLTAPMNVDADRIDSKSCFSRPEKNLTSFFWMPLPEWTADSAWWQNLPTVFW